MTTNDELTTAAALGGLTAEERLAIATDPERAKTIEEIEAFDASMRELFAPVWANAAEANTLSSLDSVWTKPLHFTGWQKRLAIGLAATVGLGVTGLLFSQNGGIGMPGEWSVSWLWKERERTYNFVSQKITGSSGNSTTKAPSIVREGRSDDFGIDSAIPEAKTIAQRGLQEAEARSNRSATSSIPTPTDRELYARYGVPTNPTGGAVASGTANERMYFFQGKDVSGLDETKRYAKAVEDKNQSMDRFGRSDSQITDKKGEVAPAMGDDRPRDFKDGKELAELNKRNEIALQRLPGITAEKPANGQPPATNAPAAAAEPVVKKIIIRSGDMEFEVTSFDGAVGTISKHVAAIPGGFVGTVNSEKMANGKVKGSVVVRVPPDKLDQLLLDLRRDLGATGELKGQRIGSQDITKQYTDLESRLRAARAMETRLLEMIKTGKGEIKQLLEAEKELGVWRTKIEEIEGELRYFSNLASLSTLTIQLTEKEFKAAAAVTESERISAGLEVEEVDQAYRAVQKVITEAKGRVIKAELKQHTTTQFTASLSFTVAPDAAGPLQDRLKQIGTVTRLSSERKQQSDGTPVPTDAKLTRGDTQFDLQLYNLAATPPRETVSQDVAVTDVPKAYADLRAAVLKAKAVIHNANVSESDKRNVVGRIDFDVKRIDEPAVRSVLDGLGDVISRSTGVSNDANATDSKVRYVVSITSAERIAPREKMTYVAEVVDVNGTVASIAQATTTAGGRIIDKSVTKESGGRMTGRITVDMPLASAAAVSQAVESSGKIRSNQTTRDANAPDGKFALARIDITLANEDRIVAADDGIWPQVKKGLSVSATVLLTSISWVIVGLCVVLPWLLVGWFAKSLLKRMGWGKTTAASA
jgi:hypothetical protein